MLLGASGAGCSLVVFLSLIPYLQSKQQPRMICFLLSFPSLLALWGVWKLSWTWIWQGNDLQRVVGKVATVGCGRGKEELLTKVRNWGSVKEEAHRGLTPAHSETFVPKGN